MWLVTTAEAPTRWALSKKVNCLIELQILITTMRIVGSKLGFMIEMESDTGTLMPSR